MIDDFDAIKRVEDY